MLLKTKSIQPTSIVVITRGCSLTFKTISAQKFSPPEVEGGGEGKGATLVLGLEEDESTY